MDIDFLFKIAAVGLIAAVVNTVLQHLKKEEYTIFVTIAGLLVGFMMLLPNIKDFFTYLKSLFSF